MAELGIVIPVYNEGENLRRTVEAIEKFVRTPHVFYIVYDFDEDTSLPVVQSLTPNRFVTRLLKNESGGVANALKLGLRSVQEPYVLVAMGDLSDDFAKVDLMCGLLSEGYDLVCGSRYMKGGSQVGGPLVKKFLSRMAGLTLHYLTGLPTVDATNSFKMYRKSMLDRLELESSGGFEVGMEALVKAHIGGFRIAEVPCTWEDRQEGESKFKLLRWIPRYLKWYAWALGKTVGPQS